LRKGDGFASPEKICAAPLELLCLECLCDTDPVGKFWQINGIKLTRQTYCVLNNAVVTIFTLSKDAGMEGKTGRQGSLERLAVD